MNIGTQLMVIGTGARSYFTPWFPKGADNAYFTYEVIHQNFGSGGGLSVTVYTKNREDPGSESATTFSFSQIGSTAFHHAACANLKDLVRLKVTVTPGTGATGAEGACYRFLPPNFYDKAV
jgi:hypothetical protein